jgi:hypothetical protein
VLDRVADVVRRALAGDDDPATTRDQVTDAPMSDLAADPLSLPEIPDRTPRGVDRPAAVVDIELVAYLPVMGVPVAWPKPEPAGWAR